MDIINKYRYLQKFIAQDLSEKMVFLGGPRQVGKTTLSLLILGENADKSHPAYLNWDINSKRKMILSQTVPAACQVVILDEIHKYLRWRNLVKGFYDQYFPKVSFLITGSAKLDHYRKGGDSLQGRYHHYRLHPYSLVEISTSPQQSDLTHLFEFGGFPEPCAKGSERFYRRWSNERMQRVIREDVRDLERVREISLIEILAENLETKVGSTLSIQSLREDLQVAHESVERWITILENLYVCFRILPYGQPTIRALKKERKLYMWDWAQVSSPGARFENLVASQLLKFCHFQEDTQGYRMELRYLRDTDKREIDFIVLQDKQILFAVECKLNDTTPSSSLSYFSERLNIPMTYQVHMGTQDIDYLIEKKIRILPFLKFCIELQMP